MVNYIFAFFTALSINGAALAENHRLIEAGNNRQAGLTEIDIASQVEIKAYECRVALPWRYSELIGREVYFLEDTGRLHGPWLVTDIQQEAHDADPVLNMENNNLLVDVDCNEMIHRRGIMLVRKDNPKVIWDKLGNDTSTLDK